VDGEKDFILKGPLKWLGTCSIIQCVAVISTKTGRQGGTFQTAPPLFKIASSGKATVSS